MPVGNGAGAPIDTSMLGEEKTIVVEGELPGATIEVQVSVDGGNCFEPLAIFSNSPGKRVINVMANSMRVFVRNRGASFTANADVGAEDSGGDFADFNIPPADGDGAPLDVSAFGSFSTFIASGDFPGVTMTVLSSEDGNSYSPCLAFGDNGGLKNKNVIAKFMKIRVRGRSDLPFDGKISIGSAKPITIDADSALTGDPITVRGPTNAEGSSLALARADHQHRLEVEVEDEGALTGARPTLNFIGAGVGAIDNPAEDRVDITIPGSVTDGAVVERWSYQLAPASTSGTSWVDATAGTPVVVPIDGDYLCIFESVSSNQAASGILEVGIGVNTTASPYPESVRASQGPASDLRSTITTVRVTGLVTGDLVYAIFKKLAGAGAVRLFTRRLTLIKVQ